MPEYCKLLHNSNPSSQAFDVLDTSYPVSTTCLCRYLVKTSHSQREMYEFRRGSVYPLSHTKTLVPEEPESRPPLHANRIHTWQAPKKPRQRSRDLAKHSSLPVKT